MSVTPTGRAHCNRSLSASTSRIGLDAVWNGLGDEYRRDADVMAYYQRCKGQVK